MFRVDDHGAYRIGIICALDLEMNAVHHIPESEHASPPIRSEDSNIYVLGRLSGHNVVIACLPGNQGKSAAAIAATNLSRTFPAIKYRIIVGIGGGVPNTGNDIRLGDVVVSMVTSHHGGVVQYDYGKDTESGFLLKGFTCQPPSVLRSAVYKLKCDVQSLPPDHTPQTRLRSTSQRTQMPDKLFQADSVHQSTDQSCEQCDPTRIVPRQPRTNDVPLIFFGLVASGDRVVKSARVRDSITERFNHDVLCFEMEAAGLIHEFPAVAIRGISDYADSHKNNGWQPYAEQGHFNRQVLRLDYAESRTAEVEDAG
ncbi:nucleoside phosphorylase domain-containing protein [Aspergillus cavernicola]|uniref:Nucleoside phosphorylase domain-containing protein n=1 Tax=Aspergillus cavernicola TaxID=176166 RepID=A0ABR4IVJ0_9EURO